MISTRLYWADVLKGFLVTLVILGHSLQVNGLEDTILWNYIYSFHMPVFFAISGYVSYRDDVDLSIIKKRAIQLLLPFFSWAILNIIIKTHDISQLISIILHPDSCYWFVYVLFFIICISFSVKKASDKMCFNEEVLIIITIVILACLMVVFEIRYFGFQFISFYLAFYSLGYLLRKKKYLFSVRQCLICGFFWFLLASFWHMHDLPSFLDSIFPSHSTLVIYLYRYITAILGCFFFFSFFIHFMNSNNYTTICLSYFGRVSLGIYIIHLFIHSFISEYYSIFDDVTVRVIVDFFLKLVISISLIYVLDKIPFLSVVFLGKTKK